MLWANGHITIDIVESAQHSGTRFKFIRQQKEWAFSYNMWGKKVSEYVEAMLGMSLKIVLHFVISQGKWLRTSQRGLLRDNPCQRLRLSS